VWPTQIVRIYKVRSAKKSLPLYLLYMAERVLHIYARLAKYFTVK
jgi:hypothetical protein